MQTASQHVTAQAGATHHSSYIEVITEVFVRKQIPGLNQFLKDAKRESGLTNDHIAQRLNVPITMVEHWFRTDKYASTPLPEYWQPLKLILNITTEEYDKDIQYTAQESVFDMQNRIYYGTAATLKASGTDLFLLPERRERYYSWHGQRCDIKETEICLTIPATLGMGGGNNTCYCVGNGQVMQTKLHDKVMCLNCMHDQQIVLIRKEQK